jgi:hypothetical protein
MLVAGHGKAGVGVQALLFLNNAVPLVRPTDINRPCRWPETNVILDSRTEHYFTPQSKRVEISQV